MKTTTSAIPLMSRLASKTLAEVMTINPLTITVDARASDVYGAMRERGVRHLPVLEDGRLVGLLSQRDFYHDELISGGPSGSFSVAHAMTRDAYVVAPGDSVGQVVKTMAERHCSCATVVDHGQVVGIFTTSNAVALLAAALET